MKKLFSILTAVFLLCALSAPVMADVIWEPNDDFYAAHAEECQYLNRRYYANSPDGRCELLAEPDGAWLADVKNGAVLAVSFTYEKSGETWGVVEYDTAANQKDFLSWQGGKESGTGWVKLSDLLLIYDRQSFEKEHSGEFKSYDGSFDDLCTSDDQRVIVWTYPGSGEINADFEKLDQEYSALEPTSVWTDGDGLVWGEIDYYMGARGWVCLSDPGNEALPVTQHDYNLYPAAENVAGVDAASSEAVLLPPQTGDHVSTGLILGVAAVCCVTAALLISLRRKKAED